MKRCVHLVLALALVAPAACSKKNTDGGDEAAQKPAEAEPTTAPAQPQDPRLQAPTQMAQMTPAVKPNAEGRYPIGSLALALPDTWESRNLRSSMRKAQFEVPPAEGDEAPAELVVYHFGKQGAGSVDANLERWYGQFQQADGSATKDKAKVEKLKAGELDATWVDVSGRYVAAKMPGSADRYDEAGYRMLAAIVEAPDGEYYFKLIGPEATVAAAADAFRNAIATAQTAQ